MSAPAAAAAASSGAKRTADEAGIGSPPPSRSQRRTAQQSFGLLNEDTLAGQHAPAALAEIQAQMDSRKWWSQWATPYLFTWLWDFDLTRPPALKMTDAESREVILNFLVEGKYARPKEGDEEAQFEAVWRKLNGWKSKAAKKAHPRPDFLQNPKPASSADAAAAMAQAAVPLPQHDAPESKQQGAGPARDGPALLPVAAPLVAASPVRPPPQAPLVLPMQGGGAPQQFEVFSESEGDGDDDMDFEKELAGLPSFVRPSHIGMPPPLGPLRNKDGKRLSDDVRGAFPTQPRNCITCLTPAPDPHRLEWRCPGCDLRGDLETGHPSNVFLAAANARKEAGQKDPEAPSSSNPGQSYAQSTAASRLERELKHLARGTPHPIFAGPGSEAPVTPKEAFAIIRKALGASATENPSEELQQLVARGLLMEVGYCIPRPLAKAKSTASSLMLMDGGEIPIQANSTGPPPVPSLRGYARALVNVILPALIAKPAAMVQWLALASTVLELEEKQGWTQADSYQRQLLQERVTQQKEFAEPSQACMATLMYAGAAASTVTDASMSSRSGGGSQSPYCEAFNWPKPGGHACAGAGVCGRLHQCQFTGRPGCTGAPGHRSTDCKCRTANGGTIGRGAGGGGSQGGSRGSRSGGGGGGYRGSGASSVASSAKPTQA